MIIKPPVVYDVSHWKEIADFGKVSPRPYLCITKATEAHPGSGFNHTDDKFVRFFDGMRAAGIFRGAYHFFRKNFNATKQAAHFVDTIRPYLIDKDMLALDIEEGGETASQIIEWINYVESKLPNLILIYSRKNILDPIPMTAEQASRLKQYPVWTAGYPLFPDLYSTVPSSYIPNQTRWGKPWLWQYSSKGEVQGIVGAVDLNWIDPIFVAYLGAPPTPPPPEPVTTMTVLINFDSPTSGTWEKKE